MSDDIEIGALTDREILVLLARGQKDMSGRLNDHGRRLRALETFRNLAAGGGLAIGAILAAVKLKLSVSQGHQ